MVLKEGSNLPLVVNYIMCRVFQADSFNVEMFSRYPFGAKPSSKAHSILFSPLGHAW